MLSLVFWLITAVLLDGFVGDDVEVTFENEKGSYMDVSFSQYPNTANVYNIAGSYVNEYPTYHCRGTPYPLVGLLDCASGATSFSVVYFNDQENCKSAAGWTGILQSQSAGVDITTLWNLGHADEQGSPVIENGSDLFTNTTSATELCKKYEDPCSGVYCGDHGHTRDNSDTAPEDEEVTFENQRGSNMTVVFSQDPATTNIYEMAGHYINNADGFPCRGTPYPLVGFLDCASEAISFSVVWSNEHENCKSATGWTGIVQSHSGSVKITTQWNLAYVDEKGSPVIENGSDVFTETSTTELCKKFPDSHSGQWSS